MQCSKVQQRVWYILADWRLVSEIVQNVQLDLP